MIWFSNFNKRLFLGYSDPTHVVFHNIQRTHTIKTFAAAHTKGREFLIKLYLLRITDFYIPFNILFKLYLYTVRKSKIYKFQAFIAETSFKCLYKVLDNMAALTHL